MKITDWIKRNYKNIVIIAGPVLYEFMNQITGEWVDDLGNWNIGIGKFITIVVGIGYLIQVIIFASKDRKYDEIISEKTGEITKLKKSLDTYKKNAKSLCNIYGYTTEKIRLQITDYKREQIIPTYYLNLTNAATIVCEQIYNNIVDLSMGDCDITVNYYTKYKQGRTFYTEMIAHEGVTTQPKYYKVRRLLKIDSDSYYCEKILDDDNPDYVFLDNKAAVTKAFKIRADKCKYNQYVGVPIQRVGSNEIIALIEIVMHNNTIVWKTQDEVRSFISRYCNQFKEYFLLIDALSIFYETINERSNSVKRGNNNGKNIEVSKE